MPRSSSRLRSAAPSSSAVDVAHGGEAPVLDELAVAVGPEVRLGVADVDDEQHGRGSICSAHGDQALRRPRLAPVRRRRSARSSSRACRTTSSSCCRRCTPRSSGVRFGARTVPAIRLESARSSRARGRSCARLEALAPEPPLYPADAAARAAVRRAERVGRRGLAADRAATALVGTDARARRDALLSAGLAAAALPPAAVRALAPARRRASSAALNAVDRRRGARRPARAARATWTASTAGSRTASSAASQSTPPTCRSPRQRG